MPCKVRRPAFAARLTYLVASVLSLALYVYVCQCKLAVVYYVYLCDVAEAPSSFARCRHAAAKCHPRIRIYLIYQIILYWPRAVRCKWAKPLNAHRLSFILCSRQAASAAAPLRVHRTDLSTYFYYYYRPNGYLHHVLSLHVLRIGTAIYLHPYPC